MRREKPLRCTPSKRADGVVVVAAAVGSTGGDGVVVGGMMADYVLAGSRCFFGVGAGVCDSDVGGISRGGGGGGHTGCRPEVQYNTSLQRTCCARLLVVSGPSSILMCKGMSKLFRSSASCRSAGERKSCVGWVRGYAAVRRLRASSCWEEEER